jgi:hypothetical protein
VNTRRDAQPSAVQDVCAATSARTSSADSIPATACTASNTAATIAPELVSSTTRRRSNVSAIVPP